MKTPRKFAEYYLISILGTRNGCNIRDIIQDKEIEEEIIDELTILIQNRDNCIVKNMTLC